MSAAAPGPLQSARPVVLHVEPAGRALMAGDLVDALTELRIGIGREAGADALVGRVKVWPPSSLR